MKFRIKRIFIPAITIGFSVTIIPMISKLNLNDVGFPAEASIKRVVVIIVVVPMTIAIYRRYCFKSFRYNKKYSSLSPL